MIKSISIRGTFVLALLTFGLIPLVGFVWYSYERAVAREFHEVKDRHLLLAHNLSSALSKYERDVRAAVQTIAESLSNKTIAANSFDLMNVLDIQSVSLLDAKDGSLLEGISSVSKLVPVSFERSILEAAFSAKDAGTYQFMPVQHTDQGNIIHLAGSDGNNLVVAQLNTNFFVELGEQIAFGVKGHAAIVDQQGNILAHPLPSWVRIAKNISKVSSVKRMMQGETGIEQFYSPALKGNMIAGLTSVPGPGWGVMIPQPVSEIYGKVLRI